MPHSSPRSLWFKTLFLFVMLLLVAGACKKDPIDNPDDNPNDTTQITPPDTLPFPPDTISVPLPECNTTYLPVIMAHGALASGDTYAPQIMRFTSNGYCNNYLVAFDWNTLGGGASASVPKLDSVINTILAATGTQQVELVGHSAGGGLGYNYLSDATRAAKVAHYVHIGSSPQSAPAGPGGSVPTLNIWSEGDAIVAGADIPGATNVRLTTADHYEVATSPETFEAMYSFFRGTAPVTTNIVPEARVTVSGRAVTLGENAPLNGATVKVYEVNTQTGFRTTEQPQFTFTTNAQGYWGPFTAKNGAYYEFFILSAIPDDRPVHYYREPFKRTNTNVYLRTLPPPSSTAGLLLAGLPKNDNQSVVAVFASSQAVVNGRDVLTLAGATLSTPQLAPASKTAIAFFAYDANNNGTTDNTSIFLFSLTPFLAGIDVFMSAAQPATITATLNGRNLNFRNWPSESEGVIVPVFD